MAKYWKNLTIWSHCWQLILVVSAAILRTTLLQEAEISTLSEEECESFGKKMKVRPEVEICGGRKIPKQFPKTFNRISDKEFRVVEQKGKEQRKGFLLGKKTLTAILIINFRLDKILLSEIQHSDWMLQIISQRTLTYFFRGNITVWLTSCLTS